MPSQSVSSGVDSSGSASLNHLQEIIKVLETHREQLEIPLTQHAQDNPYFPEFLTLRLGRYQSFYRTHLQQRVEAIRSSNTEDSDAKGLYARIRILCDGINKAVNLYYDGNLFHAGRLFRNRLDVIKFTRTTSIETLGATSRLFRARPSNGKRLLRKDLFHNPFENRHLVATSRYSIPGLPALYLGTSIYVCWEEFNQPPLKELSFSQFRSTRPLKVVKIERLSDLLSSLNAASSDQLETSLARLLRYLLLFPLALACSIKTREATGSFKPEYIIPQLLLQYIIRHKEVDGIMFPSTKVDYASIDGVPAYNYVFPVKQKRSTGYCSELMDTFVLTEPTSIELESLLNYSGMLPITMDRMHAVPGYLSLVEGVFTPYHATAFGRLEDIINSRFSLSIRDL